MSLNPKSGFLRKRGDYNLLMITAKLNKSTSLLHDSYSKFSQIRALTYWKKLKVFARVIGRFQVISKNIILYGSDFPTDIKVSHDLTSKSQEEVETFIISPRSKFKTIWDFFIIILLLYTSIFLPYQLAFDEYINETWETIDDISDIIFLADIILNFNTAIILNNGKVVNERKEIAFRYLKSWFFIDLISSLPLKRVAQFSGQRRQSSFNKFLRILKINRVYRISKFFKVMKSLKFSHKSSNLVSVLSMLFYFLLSLILSIHILACIWYYIYKINPHKHNSWNFQFVDDNLNQSMYLICIYYVFTTMTTVGYGDITPVSNTEKLYSMSLMMFGAIFYSIMVSCMINILTKKAKSEQILSDKIQVLKELSAYCKLDSSLYKKIKYSLNIQSSSHLCMEYDIYNQILSFPPSLKNDVLEHVYKSIISENTFLKSKPQMFSFSILPLLNLCIYISGQHIYLENEVADEVYLMKSGLVNIEIRNVLVRVCQQGDYFGECELIEECLRVASAITASKLAEIYTLDKKKFLDMLENFQEVKTDVFTVAKARHKSCEETKSVVRSLSGSGREITSQSSEKMIFENGLDMFRVDTGVAVSLLRNNTAKKRNRTIWAVANGKMPNTEIIKSNLNSKLSVSCDDLSEKIEPKKRGRKRRLTEGIIEKRNFLLNEFSE